MRCCIMIILIGISLIISANKVFHMLVDCLSTSVWVCLQCLIFICSLQSIVVGNSYVKNCIAIHLSAQNYSEKFYSPTIFYTVLLYWTPLRNLLRNTDKFSILYSNILLVLFMWKKNKVLVINFRNRFSINQTIDFYYYL